MTNHNQRYWDSSAQQWRYPGNEKEAAHEAFLATIAEGSAHEHASFEAGFEAGIAWMLAQANEARKDGE